MDKDRLAQRLMATFVGEVESHVRAFEQSLLALEKGPDKAEREALYAGLLRSAHSLKGAARSVGQELIETASHRLEEVLSAARDGRIATDAAFFAAMLPIVDALGETAQSLKAGSGVAGSALDERMRGLPRLMAAERPAPTDPDRAAPASPPKAMQWKPEGGELSAAIRVSEGKLAALHRQGGELLTVKHRAETRAEDAARLQDLLAEFRKEWRNLEQRIRPSPGPDRLPGDAAVVDAGGVSDSLELAINRCRDGLSRLDRSLQRFTTELSADRRVIDQTTSPLEETIRRTRMFPFAEACEGLERVVRDICAVTGKKATLAVVGAEVELDRFVLEKIKSPLLHLVRNAVDHGIEPTADRRAAGKPDSGRITVTAALRGPRVEIRVSDDGKGLDLAAIAARLRQQGQPVPGDRVELARSVFQAGISTASAVTQISGRGVGLDVVRTQLAEIRSSADVSFEPGRGAEFSLSVPLTLTVLRAVLVGVGEARYAIDTANVERAMRLDASDIVSIADREAVMLAGNPVPVLALAEAFGLSDGRTEESGKVLALILSSAGRRIALIVDTIEAEREMVVRSLGPRLPKVPGVAGGTILSNGRIVLILNPSELIDRAVALPAGRRAVAARPVEGAPRKRLLVVDDSATIRALERSILEATGYDVLVATDGKEAWEMLLETGADLVVSDVEMPRMDGFALTEAIRASRQFRDLPVVLVTAMESEADKLRGMHVGANAYHVKSAFDQRDLLNTIERLL